MGFLILGLVLLGLHVAGVAPVSNWHWLWIALPFAAAAGWWAFADASGLTRRRAERRIAERKQARRQRDIDALGLGVPRPPIEPPHSRGSRVGRPSDTTPQREERGRRDPRL